MDRKYIKNQDNKYTMKCKYVYLKENGEWNKCKRMHTCDFAHSLEQLRFLKCNLDLKCETRKNNGICLYKHSDETREEWLERTRCYRPYLPKTNAEIFGVIRTPKLTKNNWPTEMKFIESVGQFVVKKITKSIS